MERVSKKGFFISEPCAASYKIGGEQYEIVGNFKYNFTVLEMAKASIGMRLQDFCYKHEPPIPQILSDLKIKECHGKTYKKNEKIILEKITKWEKEYISREYQGDLTDRSSVVSFLFFKQAPLPLERKLLSQLGFRFPEITKFNIDTLGAHQKKPKEPTPEPKPQLERR